MSADIFIALRLPKNTIENVLNKKEKLTPDVSLMELRRGLAAHTCVCVCMCMYVYVIDV